MYDQWYKILCHTINSLRLLHFSMAAFATIVDIHTQAIPMNTTDLITQLARQLSISHAEARRMLQQELAAISQQLSEGRNVIIRGFGTLGLRPVRASKKNPDPGQTVFFRPSQKLKTLVRPWRP